MCERDPDRIPAQSYRDVPVNAARKIQGDDMRHNDAPIATIRKLGGEPVVQRTAAEYAKALNADRLKNQRDVLKLAARLEPGETNAYLGVTPSLSDPQLGKVAARLAVNIERRVRLCARRVARRRNPAQYRRTAALESDPRRKEIS